MVKTGSIEGGVSSWKPFLPRLLSFGPFLGAGLLVPEARSLDTQWGLPVPEVLGASFW